MGYAFMMAPCYGCGNPFSFHPHKVPSIRDHQGAKQPICESCYERANTMRKENGVEPWPDPLPGAYEPCPEEEL